MVDLYVLIDPNLEWDLDEADGINDDGQITGQGFIGRQQHAFLLTPVPEPGSLAPVATHTHSNYCCRLALAC